MAIVGYILRSVIAYIRQRKTVGFCLARSRGGVGITGPTASNNATQSQTIKPDDGGERARLPRAPGLNTFHHSSSDAAGVPKYSHARVPAPGSKRFRAKPILDETGGYPITRLWPRRRRRTVRDPGTQRYARITYPRSPPTVVCLLLISTVRVSQGPPDPTVADAANSVYHALYNYDGVKMPGERSSEPEPEI